MANHVGLTHIAFEVNDVEQTLDSAIKNGGQLLGEIAEKSVDGVGKLEFVYFRDPEGNIVLTRPNVLAAGSVLLHATISNEICVN